MIDLAWAPANFLTPFDQGGFLPFKLILGILGAYFFARFLDKTEISLQIFCVFFELS